MTMEKLVVSAGELIPPTEEVAAEFAEKKERVAAELNRRMGERPDLERLIGADNRSMMEDNSRNFMRFMGALFVQYDAKTLAETAFWAFRTYRAHGFQVAYWPANIDTCVEIFKEELSADAFGAVYPFFEWLIIHIPDFTVLSEAAAGEVETI